MKRINIFGYIIDIYDPNIKHWLLLVFCLLPYISVLRLGTDTQPNALIFSVLILIVNYRKGLPKLSILYFIVFYGAILVFLLSERNFRAFLSFSNYMSILLVPLAVYITLKRFHGLSFKLFKVIIIIWGVVGIVQRFFYNNFLSFLLSRISSSGEKGRGVASLAPEPTYYGTMLLLFIVVYLLNFSDRKGKDRWVLYFLIFQFFALAISATAIAVLVIALGIYMAIILVKSKPQFILRFTFFTAIGIFVLFLIMPLFAGTRSFAILMLAFENPRLILFDGSIMERFNAAYFPILSLTEQYGLPKGYNTFRDYILMKMDSGFYNDLFIYEFKATGYDRILSGYGMGFFELGFFGLIIPLTIFLSIRKKLGNKMTLLAFVIFNLVLFTAMSLNNALILFILGNMFYLSSEQAKQDTLQTLPVPAT
jgi:hypothetical protein